MGHAGAIISGRTGTPQSKVEALTRAGVPVAETLYEIVELVAARLPAAADGGGVARS
jgi:succinyl-CoA synthetase alpha subunit